MQTLHDYISTYPVAATQREWARFFGISQPYLSQILSGARTPHRDLMVRIEQRTRGAVPVIVWFDPPGQVDAASDMAAQ